LSDLLRAGYVIVCADARGTGESDGDWPGPFSSREVDDVVEITASLAAAPWSDGAVAMFGTSYAAALQLIAVSRVGHGLRCIAPRLAPFDLAQSLFPGGWLRRPFVAAWLAAVATPRNQASPEQDDTDPALVSHDDDRAMGRLLADARSPHCFLAGLRASNVPTLFVSGWRDVWVSDAIRWFADASGPLSEMFIGQWGHGEEDAQGLGYRHLAFFDRWLKGGDKPGKPPRLDYSIIGERPQRIHSSRVWPPNSARDHCWYLGAGKEHVGRLKKSSPEQVCGIASRAVDPDATTGRLSRWGNVFGTPIDYERLREDFSERGLAFISKPLTVPLVLAGSPRLELWVPSSDPELCLCALLLNWNARGNELYITEGAGRISGLQHIVAEHDTKFTESPTSPPLRLVTLTMQPIAYRLRAGDRIAVVVAGADRDNLSNEGIRPEQTLALGTGPPFASRLVVPAIDR
jgi:putative CocE/NonD family hydrolase